MQLPQSKVHIIVLQQIYMNFFSSDFYFSRPSLSSFTSNTEAFQDNYLGKEKVSRALQFWAKYQYLNYKYSGI